MLSARPGLGQLAALSCYIFLFPSNSEADTIAEIGLEETHELEIEAIRKQVNVCCAGDSLGG